MSRPEWPAAMPKIADAHDAVTPLFQAQYPHLITAFQFDVNQRGGPKFSVQARINANALVGDESMAWANLRAVIEKARPRGGVTPFDSPGDADVKFNMSCFRRPPCVGAHTAPDSDFRLKDAWMRAWVTVTAYGAFGGRPGGVLLGLRAWELIAK